jgi:hypothetical protein
VSIIEETRTEGGIGEWIKTQWRRGDEALAKERRDYWLNAAFFQGQQWVLWHDASREVVEFPRPPGDDRARITANKIAPNLVTNLAKLTKSELGFEVNPTAADDSTLAGARLAEHLCVTYHHDNLWERIRLDELLNTYFGGTSAVCVEWDPQGGEPLGLEADTGRIVNTGDIRLHALSVAEFTLEPGSRTQDDARWWIMARTMTPEQAQEHYGLGWTPTAETMGAAGPLQRRLWSMRGFPSNVQLCTVYTYYERPTRANPKGRHAVVVGDKVAFDQPWPFPFKKLNLYTFRQMQVPKQWHGITILNDVRPLQVAYNHAVSMLSEHMKKAGNARLAIPDNSGVRGDELTDEAGEYFYYDGMSSQPPRYVEAPNIPRWLIDHTNRLEEKIDDLMAVHDISRGQAPGDRNSGLALSVLAEKDETPLGLMAHDQADGWGFICSLVLELLASRVLEWRTATITLPGTNIPQQREWTGRQLRGQTRVRVPLDKTMPYSRAAFQGWFMEMAQQFPQIVPQNPVVLARMFEIPGVEHFADIVDADAAQADFENGLMLAGVIPSLDERPFPMPWDDHAKHIAEHNRLRKTRAYIYAPAEVRAIVDRHVEAHGKLALEQAINQRDLNTTMPGAGAVPQASEPFGSAVPPDYVERMQAGGSPQQALSQAGAAA